jgi:hypothetical protein
MTSRKQITAIMSEGGKQRKRGGGMGGWRTQERDTKRGSKSQYIYGHTNYMSNYPAPQARRVHGHK